MILVGSGGGGVFIVVFPLGGVVLKILVPFVIISGWMCTTFRSAGARTVMRWCGVATCVVTTMVARRAGSRLVLSMPKVRCANECAYVGFWL